MLKLTNKWRVPARVTPELNRSLNELVDWLKESEAYARDTIDGLKAVADRLYSAIENG